MAEPKDCIGAYKLTDDGTMAFLLQFAIGISDQRVSRRLIQLKEYSQLFKTPWIRRLPSKGHAPVAVVCSRYALFRFDLES
jgi:hypothetical protein